MQLLLTLTPGEKIRLVSKLKNVLIDQLDGKLYHFNTKYGVAWPKNTNQYQGLHLWPSADQKDKYGDDQDIYCLPVKERAKQIKKFAEQVKSILEKQEWISTFEVTPNKDMDRVTVKLSYCNDIEIMTRFLE